MSFYGLTYVLSFVIAALWLPILARYRQLKLSPASWRELAAWAACGVIVGGRLGYIIFYEPLFYWAHPEEIWQLSRGGMSSHGGFIGVGLAVGLWCRVQKISWHLVLDIAVIPAAIGLALGRLGNYYNQELFGTVTNLPWAVAVSGVAGLRHPVQIYETLGDVAIAAWCYSGLKRRWRAGRVGASFLVGYSILRLLTELAREPEWTGWLGLSRGQLLTLPLLAAGLFLWQARGGSKIKDAINHV